MNFLDVSRIICIWNQCLIYHYQSHSLMIAALQVNHQKKGIQISRVISSGDGITGDLELSCLAASAYNDPCLIIYGCQSLMYAEASKKERYFHICTYMSWIWTSLIFSVAIQPCVSRSPWFLFTDATVSVTSFPCHFSFARNIMMKHKLC